MNPEESKQPISNELFYTAMKNMHDRSNDLHDSLVRVEEKIDKVLVQATKTNGRVTNLEDWSANVKKIVETNSDSISGLKGDRKWMIGAAAALTLTGWFALKSIVADSIQSANNQLVTTTPLR